MILITGGAGFIGSNLARRILQNGDARVICIDNLDNFYPRSKKLANIEPFRKNTNFKFIEGDILNPEHLNTLPDLDVIVHLAAKTGVRPSLSDPVNYYQVNSIGTQMLLEFARERSISKFVFASSSSVYGVSNELPWSEQSELLPISPYASSKIAAEMMGRVYSSLYKIQFLVLRLFTVYGPGQRPDLAIQNFFEAVLNDIPISVFGDGNSWRDYTFVEDVLDAIEGALNFSSAMYEIFNIGSQNPVSLNQLIEEIEIVCGRKALINRLSYQNGDVPYTFADITKAKTLINYNPSHSIRQGLIKHHSWLKKNKQAGTHLIS